MFDPEREFGAAAQRRCVDIAQAIVDEIRASPRTPELTGALERGYRAVSAGGGGAAVVTDVEYWMHQEYGTSRMPANPHVRPAVDAVRTRSLR